MSLVNDYIENLGGYEEAKKKSTPWLLNHGENWRNIKDATLLEYRRANNVFEPDDKVLIGGDGRVWKIDTINSDGFHGTTIKEPKRCIIHIFGEVEVSHATDEEIEAGHSL